jgi:hypothetical protein
MYFDARTPDSTPDTLAFAMTIDGYDTIRIFRDFGLLTPAPP